MPILESNSISELSALARDERNKEQETAMKHFYLLESDTEYANVFVRQLSAPVVSDVFTYTHTPGSEILICGLPGPKFYGELDCLLITRTRLEDAKPIIPVAPPAETVQELVTRVQNDDLPVHVTEFLAAPIGEEPLL